MHKKYLKQGGLGYDRIYNCNISRHYFVCGPLQCKKHSQKGLK